MLDNSQEQQRSEMVSIMGLWENTDKRGNKYLSGNLGGIRVLVFKNTFKQGEREPDYRLYIARRTQEDRGAVHPGSSSQEAAGEAPQTPPEKEDDIPF